MIIDKLVVLSSIQDASKFIQYKQNRGWNKKKLIDWLSIRCFFSDIYIIIISYFIHDVLLDKCASLILHQ